VNRDPIGYRGGDMNLYGYVNGMPTYWVDPSGLECCPPPNSDECEEALDKLNDLIEKVRDEITNGRDCTMSEIGRRTRPLANAGGGRSKAYDDLACWQKEIVDRIEDDPILTGLSSYQWFMLSVKNQPFCDALNQWPKGVDRGSGDIWLIVELDRLQMRKRLMEKACKNAPPPPPPPIPTLDDLAREAPWK